VSGSIGQSYFRSTSVVNRTSSVWSLTCRAVPSMIATLSPLSGWTTTDGFTARLRPVPLAASVEKYSAPSSQTAQTGTACGRPSGRVVQIQ